MNMGAEDGFIPAKVSESIRAMETAGFAKLVEGFYDQKWKTHNTAKKITCLLRLLL